MACRSLGAGCIGGNVDQSIGQSVNQSVKQSINQSTQATSRFPGPHLSRACSRGPWTRAAAAPRCRASSLGGVWEEIDGGQSIPKDDDDGAIKDHLPLLLQVFALLKQAAAPTRATNSLISYAPMVPSGKTAWARAMWPLSTRVKASFSSDVGVPKWTWVCGPRREAVGPIQSYSIQVNPCSYMPSLRPTDRRHP